MSKCLKDVKMSKSCQIVKKMSNVKKSNTQTLEEVHKKIHIMRFTHIDVNFDVKHEGHQNCSKTLSMHILRVFVACSPSRSTCR